MGMFHYYNLKVSEVFIFDDFLINQIKEGAIIKSHHNDELKTLIHKHFNDRNIAYISNRVMSYSVDPMTYKETEQIPNLVAMAIIPKTKAMRNSAKYERQFYKKPYQIFDNLSAAIIWVHNIIALKNNVVENI